MEMNKLIVLCRVLNLYTHHAHNVTKGQTFFIDHEFFKELYLFADGAYDTLIERLIGVSGQSIELKDIIAESYKILSKTDSDHFKTSLTLLTHLNTKLGELCCSSNVSEGTKNLMAGLADQIEVFIYKIKQRN